MTDTLWSWNICCYKGQIHVLEPQLTLLHILGGHGELFHTGVQFLVHPTSSPMNMEKFWANLTTILVKWIFIAMLWLFLFPSTSNKIPQQNTIPLFAKSFHFELEHLQLVAWSPCSLTEPLILVVTKARGCKQSDQVNASIC